MLATPKGILCIILCFSNLSETYRPYHNALYTVLQKRGCSSNLFR